MKLNERILKNIEVIRLAPSYSRYAFKVIAHFKNGEEEHFFANDARHKNIIQSYLKGKYENVNLKNEANSAEKKE